MRDLVMAAERLRQVRRAHERFLALWATECLLNRREAVEQLASDVAPDTTACAVDCHCDRMPGCDPVDME